MSNHNNHDSKMIWLMMIFCTLPLVVLLFAKGGTGGYGWFAILAIGAFVIGHFWLMRKGHDSPSPEDKRNEEK